MTKDGTLKAKQVVAKLREIGISKETCRRCLAQKSVTGRTKVLRTALSHDDRWYISPLWGPFIVAIGNDWVLMSVLHRACGDIAIRATNERRMSVALPEKEGQLTAHESEDDETDDDFENHFASLVALEEVNKKKKDHTKSRK